MRTLAGAINVSPGWLLDGRRNQRPADAAEEVARIREQLAAAQLPLSTLTGVVSELTARVERIDEQKRAAQSQAESRDS